MGALLIAGCGDVGTTLGLARVAAGERVFGLRRRVERLPPSIEPVRADLASGAGLADLPDDIDRVVYIAAADRRDDAAYRAAYVAGVERLLAALAGRGAGLRRLLYVSSTSVYAQDGGQWVDEDSPAEPRGFAGRRLLEGERAARAARCSTSVVRFAGIYGPGREQLIDAVRRGAGCVETPARYTNRIHRDDCAGALGHLLDLPRPAVLYVGVDHEPAPRCTVMDWLADRLRVPRPPRIAAAAADPAARGGNKRCRGDRLRASGYRFAFPTFREGYAGILDGAGRAAPGGPCG